MSAREAAQSIAGTSQGPASNPLPGAEEGIQEDFEETVERTSYLDAERAGQSLVDQGIGIMVAVIVIGAVAIPVVQDVIASVNTSEMGIAGNILEYVTLALALGLFVAAISVVR